MSLGFRYPSTGEAFDGAAAFEPVAAAFSGPQHPPQHPPHPATPAAAFHQQAALMLLMRELRQEHRYMTHVLIGLVAFQALIIFNLLQRVTVLSSRP